MPAERLDVFDTRAALPYVQPSPTAVWRRLSQHIRPLARTAL